MKLQTFKGSKYQTIKTNHFVFTFNCFVHVSIYTARLLTKSQYIIIRKTETCNLI